RGGLGGGGIVGGAGGDPDQPEQLVEREPRDCKADGNTGSHEKQFAENVHARADEQGACPLRFGISPPGFGPAHAACATFDLAVTLRVRVRHTTACAEFAAVCSSVL